MRRRRFRSLSLVAAGCLVPSLVVAAIDSAALCQAQKIRAVARETKGLLGCHADAALSGGDVDARCLASRAARLTALFDRSEARGGCLTADDARPVQTVVDASVAEIALALRRDAGPSRCAGTKLLWTANAAARLLTAYARQRQRPNDARFAEVTLDFRRDLATIFGRVERAVRDCPAGGDADAAATALFSLAGDVGMRLWPQSRSGLTLTPPAGFVLDAQLFALSAGDTVVFTNYGAAPLVPPGGAKIVVTRLARPGGSLDAFIAARRKGRVIVSSSDALVGGRAGTRVVCTDRFDGGIGFREVFVWVPHEGAVHQFSLTHGEGDPAAASFAATFDALLASVVFAQ